MFHPLPLMGAGSLLAAGFDFGGIVAFLAVVIWLFTQIAGLVQMINPQPRAPAPGKKPDDEIRREMERRLREALGGGEPPRPIRREPRPAAATAVPANKREEKRKKQAAAKATAGERESSVSDHVRDRFKASPADHSQTLAKELEERERRLEQSITQKFSRRVGELDNDDLIADIQGISSQAARVSPNLGYMIQAEAIAEGMRDPQKLRLALITSMILERPKW